MYILRLRAAGFLYALPFIHSPPLEGSFQGWGGGACIKIGPVHATALSFEIFV